MRSLSKPSSFPLLLATALLLANGACQATVTDAPRTGSADGPTGDATSTATDDGGAALGDAGVEGSDGGSEAGTDASVDAAADADAGALSVHWRTLDHVVGAGKFLVGELTITNGTAESFDFGWRLAFHSPRTVLAEGAGNDLATQDLAAQGLRLVDAHVAEGGDVYALEALPSFLPIPPGGQRAIRLLVKGPGTHKADAPQGFYLVLPGEAPRALHASVSLDASDPLQTTRQPNDVLPVQTAGLRYAENQALAKRTLDARDRLLPTPVSVTSPGGTFTLTSGASIGYAPALAGEAAYVKAALGDVLAGTTTLAEGDDGATIVLAIDANLAVPGAASNAEGYTLSIGASGVRIVGADAAGVFHGIQTLRQLVPREAYLASIQPAARVSAMTFEAIEVVDAPQFRYRGMSLDVARHFQSKETVMKLLDLLAHYKMNALHFHLTDDEGWRLEIPGLPELTSYGGRRGYDPAERTMLHSGHGSAGGLGGTDGLTCKAATETEANGGTAPRYQGFEEATLNFVGTGSGYYTTEDFERILAYAAERHIDVIPEIDVPGHARAAVKAMELRYRTYAATDPTLASEYRLVDPFDTSVHVTPQGVRDNFVNPCLDSTYAFLSKVVTEIAARYAAVPNARLTMIHGGGDELPASPNVWWQGSPICKATPATANLSDVALRSLFLSKWATIVAGVGVPMTGWDDILVGSTKPAGFVAMAWNNVWGSGNEDNAYKLANAGTSVILAHATNLYMSQAANKDPDEPGTYWANYIDEKRTFEYRPFDVFVNGAEDRFGNAFVSTRWDRKVRITEPGKANILGMEGLIWSENVRSPRLLEYFTFPKVLGVAERAWNREMPAVEDMPIAWERFVNTLGQAATPILDAYRAVDVRGELPREHGVNYRIPLPGAKIEAGVLDMNVRFPGMALEYSLDGGLSWLAFTAPTPVASYVLVRTKTSDGRWSRIARVDPL